MQIPGQELFASTPPPQHPLTNLHNHCNIGTSFCYILKKEYFNTIRLLLRSRTYAIIIATLEKAQTARAILPDYLFTIIQNSTRSGTISISDSDPDYCRISLSSIAK